MKKFTLPQAQQLVNDAIDRSRARHAFWASLETLFRTGQTGAVTPSSLTGTLFDHLSAEDLETVNLILPRVRLQVARLTARDPRPVVQATGGGPEAEAIEGVVEATLEYFWHRSRGTSIVRDIAQDLVVIGNAFVKVGWDVEEDVIALDESERFAQEAMAVELERQSALLEGREMAPLDDVIRDLPSETTLVVRDEPYVSYVRPFDVFLPADARRLEEARWVAQRVFMSLDEAKERYPGHEFTVSALDADLHLSEDARSGDTDVVELFEFWDQATRSLMVFAADSAEACFEGDWPHSHRYAPLVHVAHHRARPSELWGFGDLQTVAGLQHRFNEVWTTIVDSTFRSGRKYLAVRGTLDEDAVAALESDVDEAVVFVDGPAGESPANLVAPLWRQPISGEVIHTQEKLQMLIDDVLALNDFDTGGVGSDRMSATAAAAVMGVAEERAVDKQLLLEEACSQIYTLMLLLCQEFLTTETAIRIAGPTGSVWPSITGSDLSGEFRIRVETGSMNGESRSMRRSEGVQLLTTVVPTLAGLGYDVDGVVRSALKRMGYDPQELGVNRVEQPMAAPEQAAVGPAPSAGAAIESLTGLSMPAELQERGDI